MYFIQLQRNNSKKSNQTDAEAIKKKKLTSRQRKALTKIIEKKQKSQKVTKCIVVKLIKPQNSI